MFRSGRRHFVAVAGAAIGSLCIGACTTTRPSTTNTAGSIDDHDRAINAEVSATLERLYATVKGSHELIGKAYGVLVFPSVLSAGFIVGAQYGEGALRVGGRTEGYYSSAGGSFGPQIGAQSKALIFVFLTEDSLVRFRRLDGWAAGADATVALLKVGANGDIDTSSATSPIEVLVLTNAGLMAGISLEGTKITRLKR
ncbi:YSC84-related protein (plasmid) [Paraburkholderia sp. PREW-6R]|uniref:BPSL1445 family SYLF domain-containing lipoprotein n=1 Tax=Paraburkholderia sp. PREW-6R TaxID=3141544 RepID=UPI0031F5A510